MERGGEPGQGEKGGCLFGFFGGGKGGKGLVPMRRDVNPLNLIRDNFVIIVCTVGLFSYTVLFQLSTPPHSRSEMDSEIGKAHEIDSLEGVLTDGGGENVPDEQPTLEYGPAGSPITPADDTAKNPSGFPVEEEDHIAGAYDEEEGEQKEEDEEEQEPEAMIEVPHNPLSGEVDVKALLDSPLSTRIIVSTKLKAMYCPIPKVACSNWKALFRRLEGHNDYKNLALAHDRERSGLKYLKDFSEEEVGHFLLMCSSSLSPVILHRSVCIIFGPNGRTMVFVSSL